MKLRSQILFAIFMWTLLMWSAGYRFGTGDHPEYLPYVLFLNDQTLYAHDFFIQGLQEKVPNERTIFAYFLLLFVNNLEIACFILHFIFTVLLITGLQKLGSLLTGNIHVTQIAILINFLFFFDRGLGNVELYSDAVQSSNISVAVISWALYYFFSNRWLLTSILLSIASIIHPVEGLTVSLVVFSCMASGTMLKSDFRRMEFFKATFIYCLTAGIFILTLVSGKIDGINAFNHQFDKETFFKIYHEFRHAHHYVFEYFPLTEKLLFILFILVNLFYGHLRNKTFFRFNMFALAGTITYIICTDYLHVIDIANLQFYKTSQWVKFFAILVSTQVTLNLLGQRFYNGMNSSLKTGSVLIATLVFSSILIMQPAQLLKKDVHYQFGAGWKSKDDMVQISEEIRDKVDIDAVFVQPFSCTELKYYGIKSSWVDWKAFLKNRSRIFEWYRRIQVLYGISISDDVKGFELRNKADAYFFDMSEHTAQTLKKEGVTHILTPNKEWQYGQLLFANNTYAVYQL